MHWERRLYSIASLRCAFICSLVASVSGRTSYAVILCAALIIAAPSIFNSARAADEQLVTFEALRGPPSFTGVEAPLTVGHATFSGGQVLTNVARLRRVNRTSVYGVWHRCTGCANTITIEFSQSVSDVSFMLMNARMGKLRFEVSDDTGHTASFVLNPYFLGGSSTTVTLPSTGISRIVIGEAEKDSPFWHFFVDNLRYAVNEGQEYLVSFSAFIPHDNVPGGPTASCLARGNLPPGLVRRGLPPRSKARWKRDAGLPGGGRATGNRVFGTQSADEGDGRTRKRRLYFAGDNRGFSPAAPTYRVRQLVTVIHDETQDTDGIDDGIKDGSLRNLADEVRAYADDAMADGVINVADEDGTSNDCHLFHQANLAETDLMDIEVARTGPNSLEIRFRGTLHNPLVGPSEVLGAIDWDFAMTLDASADPVQWTLNGAHDGFPAYEIYVNGETVYQYDPGVPPYEFSRHVRKLLPPLDVAVTSESGGLQ